MYVSQLAILLHCWTAPSCQIELFTENSNQFLVSEARLSIARGKFLQIPGRTDTVSYVLTGFPQSGLQIHIDKFA